LNAPATTIIPGAVLTRRHYSFAAGAFLVFVIYGSLVPFHFRSQTWNEAVMQFQAGLTGQEAADEPLLQKVIARLRAALTLRDLHSRSDFLANVLLFVPLGFLLMGSLTVDRPWWITLLWAPAVLLFGCCLSTAIEFTQTFFPPRCPDLNDIVGETAGAGLGTASWLGLGRPVTRRCRDMGSLEGAGRWSLLLPGYVAFLILLETLPLDLTLSPADIYHKYRDGRIQLIPFVPPPGDRYEWIEKQCWRLALFFPVGWLLRFDHARFGKIIRTWPRVLIFGILTTAFVEFLKIFVVSRNVESGDIITGSLAVLAGWMASKTYVSNQASISLQQKTARGSLQMVLGFIWVGILLFVNWHPFDFRLDAAAAFDRIRQMSWLPFLDYYQGSYLNFLHQIVRKTLLFIPVGLLGSALASSLFSIPTGWRSLVVIGGALGVAIVLEIGQAFLPTRYPSITDILVETAGAVLGCVLAKATGRVRLGADTMTPSGFQDKTWHPERKQESHMNAQLVGEL
jgi:glycopeptide antibiotics resistance protein